MPFSRELYIERDDFMEDPPKKFFRLAPGREVRLRYAYLITCTDVVKDDAGEVVELRCTYDPETRGRNGPRRPQGEGDTPLGVSAPTPSTPRCGSTTSVHQAETRTTSTRTTWLDHVDPNVPRGPEIELPLEPEPRRTPVVARRPAYQFERQGYFCADPDSASGRPVFNRTVTLRDSWAKMQKKG